MSEIEVSRPVLQILSVVFGMLGIDRFYAGQSALGVLKLITCGACGMWASIDALIQIFEGVSKSNITRYGANIKIRPDSIQSGYVVGLVLLVLAGLSFVMHRNRNRSGGAVFMTTSGTDNPSDAEARDNERASEGLSTSGAAAYPL